MIGVGVPMNTTEGLSHVLRNTESVRRIEIKNLLQHVWGVCVCVCVCLCVCMGALSCPTLAIPWTIAHQAPLSMGFSSPPGSSVHGISQTRILE